MSGRTPAPTREAQPDQHGEQLPGPSADTTCVPIAEHPSRAGDPCVTVDVGPVQTDNCDSSTVCWDLNAENKGTCATMCGGNEEQFICPPGHWCEYLGRGGAYAGICIPNCDPLAQDCGAGETCLPHGSGFLCNLDASGDEGQAHDPCWYGNDCDPGLYCNDPSAAMECDPRADGCCEPFCDLTDPILCPGWGQKCLPYYEADETPPGLEHLGHCALPP